MRRIVCLVPALALALAASGAARADEQADLKMVIDNAIKAAGGDAKLAKFNTQTFKLKGKFYGMGEGIDFTGDYAVQQPDKLRATIETNMNFTFVRVVNGDKVWMKVNGETQALDDKDQIAEAKDAAYASWVVTLLPLIKEKGFQLAALGEAKVDGKPAVGVRVSHKGQRDVNLFFDKEKGWLVKTETVVKDLMGGGQEVTQETLLSDYKDVKGAQRSMKIVINRDGKKYIDGDVSDIEPQDKIDDSVFGKP